MVEGRHAALLGPGGDGDDNDGDDSGGDDSGGDEGDDSGDGGE